MSLYPTTFVGSEICLNKLGQLESEEKVLAAYEDEFFKYPRHNSITTFKRSKESSSADGPITKVFECIKSIKSTHFMFLNPCHAHAKIDTIQLIIDKFKKHSKLKSASAVVSINDWIIHNDKIISNINKHGNTKIHNGLYRVAHLCHIIDKGYLLENEKIWPNKINDPYFFEISSTEAIDVDTEEEFIMSESLYRNYLSYKAKKPLRL